MKKYFILVVGLIIVLNIKSQTLYDTQEWIKENISQYHSELRNYSLEFEKDRIIIHENFYEGLVVDYYFYYNRIAKMTLKIDKTNSGELFYELSFVCKKNQKCLCNTMKNRDEYCEEKGDGIWFSQSISNNNMIGRIKKAWVHYFKLRGYNIPFIVVSETF